MRAERAALVAEERDMRASPAAEPRAAAERWGAVEGGRRGRQRGRSRRPHAALGSGHTEGRSRRPRPGAMRSGRGGRCPSAPVPPRRAVLSTVRPQRAGTGAAGGGGGGEPQGPGRAAMSPPIAEPAAAVQLSVFPLCKWLQQPCPEHRSEWLAVIAPGKPWLQVLRATGRSCSPS